MASLSFSASARMGFSFALVADWAAPVSPA